MKKVWLTHFSILLAITSLALGCEKKTTAPRSNHTTATTTKIVAQIGNYALSQNEFVQAYQQWGHGQTPEQFLQKMIDELLSLREAERLHIDKTIYVQQTVQKSMIRTLLRRDFERWFTPDAIDILKVRKYYHENNRRYSRPTLAQVAHILVRLPSNPRMAHTLSPLEKNLLASRSQSAKDLAQTFLRQVQQQSPRNKQEFIRLGLAFAKTHNTPDPDLIAWYQSWSRSVTASPTLPKAQLIKTTNMALRSLDTIPFCQMCASVRSGLHKQLGAWNKQPTTTIASSAIRKEVEQVKSWVFTPRRLVTTEDLPPFPQYSTPNWPAMVDEFAHATFALSDKQYSRNLCKTVYGYHIIFREKTLPSFQTPLLQAAPNIRRILFEQERTKRYKQWLQSKYQGIKMVGYFSRLQEKPKKP